MGKMLGLQAVVVAAVAAVATMPPAIFAADMDFLGPYKMTWASADPGAAQAFVIKYLGAELTPQPHKGGNGECAMVKWVKFRGTNPEYNLHFVKGYTRPNGTMTVDEFEDTMFSLHGNLSAGVYDQYYDFRVTMTTADLDPLVARLVQDSVPFLTRYNGQKYSVFVEVPHAIIIEIESSTLTCTSAARWDLCSSGASAPLIINHEAVRRAVHRPLPLILPSRAQYASTDPTLSAAYLARLTGAEVFTPSINDLPDAPSSCFTVRGLRWPQSISDYEVWFTSTPQKRQPNGLTLSAYASYLRHLHGEIQGPGEIYDEYMDFHIGLWFTDADPLYRTITETNESWFGRGQYGHATDLFVEGPFGQIFELLGKTSSIVPNLEDWELCGHQ